VRGLLPRPQKAVVFSGMYQAFFSITSGQAHFCSISPASREKKAQLTVLLLALFLARISEVASTEVHKEDHYRAGKCAMIRCQGS